MGLWGSLLLFLPAHRVDPMRGMAILGSKSGKTAMMRHLKPAVYRSGNAHSITDTHANVAEMTQ